MAWRWQRLLAARGIHDRLALARPRVLRRATRPGRCCRRRSAATRLRIYETTQAPSRATAAPIAGSVLLERALGGAATLVLAGDRLRARDRPLRRRRLPLGRARVRRRDGRRSASCSSRRRLRRPLARTRAAAAAAPPRAAAARRLRGHPRATATTPWLLVGVFALTLAVQAVRVLAIWLAGEGGRRRPLAAAVLRDGAAALPRHARAVHDQRARRARGVLRQLPRRSSA